MLLVLTIRIVSGYLPVIAPLYSRQVHCLSVSFYIYSGSGKHGVCSPGAVIISGL